MDEVTYSTEGRVARITLDRPERMNAMTDAMYDEVGRLLQLADADPVVRCILVTGSGERAFSAGHDLYELGSDREARTWQPYRAHRWDSGLQCATPTVAVIDGYCLAGGLELALFCDIRIASTRSQFGSPEVKWNILHGYGALRLPDMIGMSQTMYLLLTGDFIDAATALRVGLVSHLFPPERLEAESLELARRVAGNGPGAARLIKELAYRGRDLPLSEGLRLYHEYGRIASSMADNREGTRAFAERRTPEFNDA